MVFKSQNVCSNKTLIFMYTWYLPKVSIENANTHVNTEPVNTKMKSLYSLTNMNTYHKYKYTNTNMNIYHMHTCDLKIRILVF